MFGVDTVEYARYHQQTLLFTGVSEDNPRHAERLRENLTKTLVILRAAVFSLEESQQHQHSPADKAINAYEGLALHPEIRRAASALFRDGHYSNAVQDAVKALNGLVRLRSGLEVDGVSLMQQAFSPKNPVLAFNNLMDQSDKAEQQGFMNLFCGAVSGLRNPRAHAFIEDDAERALEFIAFVSLLAKLLDGAKRPSPASSPVV